ncbi:MAG TPA: hypothetical protein VFJ65_04265 [Solirubrobacterales bacterium]|nr:hypothetical protein [Solirubrobacterales bacterium]
METLEMEARMHDLSNEQFGTLEERLAQTATRGDVTELRSEIKESSAELRKEIKESAAELREEMKESAAELREEMKESAAELRKEIKESAAELRREMVVGFAEMRSSFEGRLDRIEDRFHRLNYTLITGAIGVIVALIGFHG